MSPSVRRVRTIRRAADRHHLPLSWLALSMKDESVPDVRHVRDRHGPAARPWGEQDLYGLLRGLELLPNEPISF